MPDDYEEHFFRFFRGNADLGSLLRKIDEGKIDGDYYASKAIRRNRPGYILRIKMFVPAMPKAKDRRRDPISLEEVWIVRDQARLLLTTPPDLVALDSLSYDGNWLRVYTVKGKQLSFFLGLPLVWRKMKATYSNGVLQVVAPVRLRVHSRMKLSNAATKASKV